MTALPARPFAQEQNGNPGRPSGYVWDAFPDADLYPHYIADPRRAQSAMMLAAVSDTEIPEAGGSRFVLRLGGRFTLVRCHPEGEPERGFQLDFEGGFFAHFDRDHSLDNIGWDGVYGLLVSWRPNPRLALRAGALHDSAHLGDEYADRTGRTRIGYTREELVLGVSWQATHAWRAYAEAGYDSQPKELQREMRAQAGVEYVDPRRFWKERLSWYVAADFAAYEETGWKVRPTVQLGVIWPVGQGSRRYRLALEYSEGRSALGELFLREETVIGLGWYFDF